MAFLETDLWISKTKNGSGVKIELDDFNCRLVTSEKQLRKLLDGKINGVKLSMATNGDNESNSGNDNDVTEEKGKLSVEENKVE